MSYKNTTRLSVLLTVLFDLSFGSFMVDNLFILKPPFQTFQETEALVLWSHQKTQHTRKVCVSRESGRKKRSKQTTQKIGR